MRRIAFLFLIILLLAGCRGASSLSPTPFPTAGASVTLPAGGPVALTVAELMSAPGLYRDTVVQLTGRLSKQPLIVCDTDLRPSPAGWGLAEEGVLALAGGYEQQVRSLLPDDLMMTVEGRWRQWNGLVGCGKHAQQQEVWYLEVGRILTPSPLTQVTLTPGAGVEVSAVGGATQEPGATQEALGPTPVLEETPTAPGATEAGEGYPGPTNDSSTGIVTPTLAIEQTATPTLPSSGSLTAVATGTITTTTGTPGTGTPGGTPSPTVTGTPPTQTPTATGGAPGQVVAKGNLYDVMENDFLTTTLASGTIDSWELDIFEEDSLFVYVVAPAPADLIVSVLKDGEPIVNRQNTASAGTPEFVDNPTLQGEGLYEIQILTNGGDPTNYALTFYTDPDFPITFPGIITSGSPRSAVQLPEGAYQYWFFVASAGDELTLRLDPLDDGDPAMYLYDPTGEEIDSVDDGFEGEEEILETTIPTDGLYGIEIEEIFAEPFSYDLELTLQ